MIPLFKTNAKFKEIQPLCTNANPLKTLDGQAEHREYLEKHPNLSPLQVLFGECVPKNPTSECIKQRAFALLRTFHPDKNPGLEDPGLEEITKRINQATEDLLGGKETGSNIFSGFHNQELYEETVLYRHVYSGKWSEALEYLKNVISTESLEDDSILYLFMAMLYSTFDKRCEASHCLDKCHSNLKDILDKCWEEINGRRVNYKQAEKFIGDIRDYASSFCGDDDTKDYILKLTELIIPIDLFIVLKDYYRDKDNILYETHLRTAIRRCPSSKKDFKQKLIEELKEHTRRYCSSHVIYSPETGKLNIINAIQKVYAAIYVKMSQGQMSMAKELSFMENKGFANVSEDEWSDLIITPKHNDDYLLLALIKAKQHEYPSAIRSLDEYLKHDPLNKYARGCAVGIMDYCDTLYIAEESTTTVRSTDALNVKIHGQFDCICAREQSCLFDQATNGCKIDKPLSSRVSKRFQQSLLGNIWKNAIFGSVPCGILAGVAFGTPLAIAACTVIGYIACAFFISLRTSFVHSRVKNEIAEIVSSFKQTVNAEEYQAALSRAKKHLLEGGYLIQNPENSSLVINVPQLEKTAQLLDPSEQISTLNWLKLMSCLILEGSVSKNEEVSFYMNALFHSMSDKDRVTLQQLQDQRNA